MSPPIDRESLLEELADGVFVSSKDGVILYANRALWSILGYSEEELRDKNISKDLVERNLEWRAMVSILEQGSPVEDYEMKIRRADGVIAICSMSATFLRNDRGEFVGILASLRDISTRKGFEGELREKVFRTDVLNKIARIAASETDLRKHALVNVCTELHKLISFDKLAVGITEENGRHVEVITTDPENPTLTKSLGLVPLEDSMVEKVAFSRSPLVVARDVGRKGFSEYAVLDAAEFSSMMCIPLVSRGKVLGSVNVFHKKPSMFNIEMLDVLQTVADQVSGLIDNMVLLNSLEKKIRTQDALVKTGVELQKTIETEQIYESIASNLKEVVPFSELSFYVIDLERKLVVPVYAEGPWKDEVMAAPGTMDEGVVGAVARSGKAEFMDDVDADPRSVDVPGTPKEHHSMLAIPLVGPKGVMGVLELYRPRGHVFTKSDLEAGLLFAQQASVALAKANVMSNLQEAKREIELLNDLMFHDINNYNFATLNYIQMLSSSPQLSADQRSHLEKAIQLIRQTSDLIENVKKLTKIGVMDPRDFTRVDLADVLRQCASALENSFPGKQLSVSLDLPESCYVMANKLIEELFFNLLSNSVKYDPHEEVEIDIHCSRVNEDGKLFWKVTISDRGSGIPDDKKPQLFQKYIRLKPDPKVTGTGLGLSICRALTDKFGGRIWVEDRVAGKSELGARFCVSLPAAKDILK